LLNMKLKCDTFITSELFYSYYDYKNKKGLLPLSNKPFKS